MARIVYTDLDGTMVGPRGSFWHTADRELTEGPAAALLDLHRAGVALVLVSGRTFEQVVEAARIFAADGATAELGATIAWDGGRGVHRSRGDLPAEYGDRTPMSVMTELGVVEELIAGHGTRRRPAVDHRERRDGMAGLLDAVPNVTVTDAAMGEGWAQAIRASL